MVKSIRKKMTSLSSILFSLPLFVFVSVFSPFSSFLPPQASHPFLALTLHRKEVPSLSSSALFLHTSIHSFQLFIHHSFNSLTSASNNNNTNTYFLIHSSTCNRNLCKQPPYTFQGFLEDLGWEYYSLPSIIPVDPFFYANMRHCKPFIPEPTAWHASMLLLLA
ncbi:hypothetical protein BCR41DRAFT_183588 [Lobosporangium transversale]|uniref:Uncharacterized protein n=1 Tax=Lobosporangium transversale TaxID=64571 RepID=A0A1Y2GXV0_9FUNG|nr:hypothetical protein BCR41DRAFT_183588 [Lobosporangium transversale]ORZ27106.1 hypothetical protein BCR41DRAFT_183588 [Lobosporangium transversale]|eukprot:XP_021884853.1 hypothetical protein BCR41DRAFT_183588 [Lobosporangium transversale]